MHHLRRAPASAFFGCDFYRSRKIALSFSPLDVGCPCDRKVPANGDLTCISKSGNRSPLRKCLAIPHLFRARLSRTKVTEKAQNADFRRKPQIFADSPLLLEIEAFGGRRKPENCRKPQIGLRHLRSVTFSSALSTVKKSLTNGDV